MRTEQEIRDEIAGIEEVKASDLAFIGSTAPSIKDCEYTLVWIREHNARLAMLRWVLGEDESDD